MIGKFIKYQYRSGALFYTLCTLVITFICLWGWYRGNDDIKIYTTFDSNRVFSDKTAITFILWIGCWWFISMCSVLIYHLTRFAKITSKPERFLLFSSYKLKPSTLMFGEIFHIVLDLLLYSIWFSIIGAAAIGPKRYVSVVSQLITKIVTSNSGIWFVVFVATLVFFATLYFWFLTGNVYLYTAAGSSKFKKIGILLFILAVVIQLRLTDVILKISKNSSTAVISLLVFNFAVFILLLIVNIRMLTRGLDT